MLSHFRWSIWIDVVEAEMRLRPALSPNSSRINHVLFLRTTAAMLGTKFDDWLGTEMVV